LGFDFSHSQGEYTLKIPIIIDGHMVQVDEGTTVLNAARKADVNIPTLRVVTSCTFPAGAGMEVFTDTSRVKKLRKKVVELLLARCPDVPLIQTMARHMGIENSRLRNKENEECILCGLCVRFCEEVVGVNAIGLSNRGVKCEVATPFKVSSDTCIGCGSCTYICPTGCIEMVEDERTSGMRKMNMGRLPLEPCKNDYKCEECDIEGQFIEGMRKVIAQFRNKFGSKSI
jgi:NADH dehydrogenase/NADH:ubiquinone oxidoreductase subunit G